MEDDIYGDLELSSSSSSSSPSTAATSASAKANSKEKHGMEEADHKTGTSRPPSPPVKNDHDIEKEEKRRLSRCSPRKKRTKDEHDDLDAMDLMDEGLTNKFKETARNKTTSDYGRTRAPPTRANDIQVEKLKHEIAELKKANRQLEINLALLYKSSHHIISLKDKELSKLKSKYDALCFRRKQAQESTKSLPLIAPQVSDVSETRPVSRTQQESTHEHAASLGSVASREKLTDELDTLRNYLPKRSQRAPSESSCKSQQSRGRRTGRRKSPALEDFRPYKENNETDCNSRHDKRRGNERRGGRSYRDKPPRKDSRDRYQRDRHRDAHEKDHRDRRLDTDRRDRRPNPEVSYRRDERDSEAESRHRKRKAESETESAKRQRRHDRRTPDESSRLVSVRSERDEANRSDRWKLASSNSNRDLRRSVSPQTKKCRLSPQRTERHADLTATEETTKRLSCKGSVEIDMKGFDPGNRTHEREVAKEDGEISESGTDSSSQMIQELRRSPRKSVRSKVFPAAHREPSLESKPEKQLIRPRSRSSQGHSSTSTKSRSKLRSPHGRKASKERHPVNGPRTPLKKISADTVSPKRSSQKLPRDLKAGEDPLSPRRTPSGKRSPSNKHLPASDNAASASRSTTPTLRRSPRKTMRDLSEQLVIKNPNFPHISPTNSESPKTQSVLRDHPCKIPSRRSDQVEDPREPRRVNESVLFLTIPQYLEEDSAQATMEQNSDQELYKSGKTRQLEANTPLRRSPRKKPRPLPHSSLGEAESPANVYLSNEMTLLDLLPLKTRTSLNSDNDKPKTPTLSPASSSMTPTGSVVGQSLAPTEAFGWHDANFTPLDSSIPPETPGKEFSATPLAATTKNGKSVDEVGRILRFDKVM